MSGTKTVKSDKEKNDIIFTNLIRIADTIAQNFGKNCEVAVHDLSNLDKSLIYIAGDITHRQPGAPITDLVVKVLHQEGDRARDMVGYKSITKEGRILKSSTTFIRNGAGKIIGALCINFDITDFQHMQATVGDLINLTYQGEDEKKETFASTVHETIDVLVAQASEIVGKPPATMSMEEKIKFVATLEQKGAFLIKGAVDYIATVLGVSKYTVYNYLQKVRSTEGLNFITK
ncbi:helix-turn-helix transcriptional regulator [Desulforamulus hydrothermalis]|uniref:Putative DNA-binding transcriptional regulator n=1 Tax=Desulforamulus hydrothermalis Lam5 = DSM 18033 TaxID=1121428 RepID=K8E091_9FIRM|nr:helix-turn-helix transcriptional regulator [Desulforamulus hydrothermalis]CCO08840.1 putative DNA-binding transcriptional regulator [Desulforamulus hydrothermalis Lam5 = DSM 18033]SHG72908.1 Predicted transcriptional regulator YheO, contains PAS and DNA-binding HTH domains [Desulforamulus hydrothermalis Lam5 = DSM 18033]